MVLCYFFFPILVTLYCDTGNERDTTRGEGPVLLGSTYETATVHTQSVLMVYGEHGGKASRIEDQDNNGDE